MASRIPYVHESLASSHHKQGATNDNEVRVRMQLNYSIEARLLLHTVSDQVASPVVTRD